MAKKLLMSAALAVAVASLTACAGISADVHALGPVNSAVVLRSGSTYAITRMPLQEGSADHLQFEALLRDELARRGFTDAAGQPAQYLLSIAYDTRLAEIGVDVKDCPSRECAAAPGAAAPDAAAPGAPFSLSGSPAYRHSLTLRFFDRASGEQRYKVSAIMVDRDADPQRAMPALMTSALAKFPFDAPPDWRVKLCVNQTGAAPEVVSVKPLQR